jgi:hypothetical protein
MTLIDVLKEEVKWPNEEGCRQIALKFFEKTEMGIARVIGAADGTLVPITCPAATKFNSNSYYSRKHCYAISCLGVCDANYRFLFFSAKHPGYKV